ncbi:hypothetical protein FAGAP_7157 [Fusarium agapanthi]|uniref:Uncharacterized protein n=1 Tax=Fusarium agapanthi TaxID=1803897 RepID=A0A9P5BDJ8_9HYPO|nr:hypothetical protein FAGAP_7157 [Fusarium agapanthi]
MMYSLTVLIAACTALTAGSPTRPNSAGLQARDDLLGPATCPDGDSFALNEEDAAAGAEGFKLWVEQGADGKIDLSVQSVLRKDGYLDSKCGSGSGGYESSNDLSIGRSFNGDHYC